MRIIVESKEEQDLIRSLCDIALKAGGISNLNGVGIILAAVGAESPETSELKAQVQSLQEKIKELLSK